MFARTSRAPRSRVPTEGGTFLDELLDPIDQLAVAIYGVLSVLTFTLAFRIIKMGANPREPISTDYLNELVVAMIGAMLAWGIIDGVMHALLEMFQRGERQRLLHDVKTAMSEEEGIEVVADEFDDILEPITDEAEREVLYRNFLLYLRDNQPRPVGFQREDLGGALACLLVTILAVAPSLLPFAVVRQDPALAVRLSNIISFAILFAGGYYWGKYTGASPVKTGGLLFVVGVLLVAIAIPLGG